MPAPKNKLKAALARRELQIGIWLGLCSPAVAEMAGAAGYDWCLIDGEHGPNDLPLMADQLRALEGHGASAVVRVPQGRLDFETGFGYWCAKRFSAHGGNRRASTTSRRSV